MAIYSNMLPVKKTLLLIAAAALITPILADWEHDHLTSNFNKRSLLYVRSSGSNSRSRSSLPIEPIESLESGQDSSAQVSSEPQQIVQVNSVESAEEDTSSSASSEVQAVPVPRPVKIVPVILPSGGSKKGEGGRIVVKKVPVRKGQEVVESDEDDLQDDREFGAAQNDLISFSYYPIKQQYDSSGAVVYEIQDTDLRTARGGGKGKKKKGCKKGKKGKKGRSKKGKKKGKKGCSVKGGWWYVWDKKHGYISGRWGTPPPKGLEREHYWHNYGKHGHGYGQGYDGHGHMGWKVKQQGWGWGGQGGGGGGGGGFGGFGGGGYGGHGGHGHHGHHGGHGGGWGVPHKHYGWGWAEKVKGWGWRR